MTDILGTRLEVVSLVPSTNSSGEPEFAAMARLVEAFEARFAKPVGLGERGLLVLDTARRRHRGSDPRLRSPVARFLKRRAARALDITF